MANKENKNPLDDSTIPNAPAPEVDDKKADKKTKVESEKVEVTKEDLEVLMKRLSEQDKTINLLMETADKGRLAKAMSATNTPLIYTVRVNKYDPVGKLVVGWKTTINQCEIINGRWVEDQRTLLMFEDGTTIEVTLLDFYRKMSGVKGEIISRREERDIEGNVYESLTIRMEDGKELTISKQFVN